MPFMTFGGFARVGVHVHIMQAIGWLMIVLIGVLFYGAWPTFRRAVDEENWSVAGASLNTIRQMIAINLPLGLIVVAIGASGRYWGCQTQTGALNRIEDEFRPSRRLFMICSAGTGSMSGAPLCWRCSHEIALTKLDTALPDDVVGGRRVEEEIWQAVTEQQALPGELPSLAVREGDTDVLALGTIDLALLEALEIIDGLGDAIFQLSNGCFIVGELQKLFTSETSCCIRRMIGRCPHLARQIEHIR